MSKAAERLKHDPEKWEPVVHATNAERVCAQIMRK